MASARPISAMNAYVACMHSRKSGTYQRVLDRVSPFRVSPAQRHSTTSNATRRTGVREPTDQKVATLSRLILARPKQGSQLTDDRGGRVGLDGERSSSGGARTPRGRPAQAGGYDEDMGARRELLEAKRDEITAIVRRHRGRSVAVFGSVARGDETNASDIDFLVEFEPGSSLFDLLHLQDELRSLLGSDVDVVSKGALKPRDAHIRREAVPL